MPFGQLGWYSPALVLGPAEVHLHHEDTRRRCLDATGKPFSLVKTVPRPDVNDRFGD